MNREQFEKLCRDSLERRLKLSAAKGADYATEDVLSNFKRMAEVGKAFKLVDKPYLVALTYMLLKIDRIRNLLAKGVEPRNEPLRDSIDDLKNYLDLFEACLVDEGVLHA